jgi:hypothetical protein
MTVFRNPMEKILEQQEEGTPITNPKEPIRTFFRKVAFRTAMWVDRVRRFFSRRPEENREQK